MAADYILKTYVVLSVFGTILFLVGVVGFFSFGVYDACMYVFAESRKKKEDRLKKIEKELEELKKQAKATT